MQSNARYVFVFARGLLRFTGILIAMFVLAGRIDYWQAWVWGGIGIGIGLLSGVLFRRHSDLIEERVKPGPGVKWWDILFFAVYIPSLLAILAVASLDVGRFSWSPALPPSVYVVGYCLLLFSYGLPFWAMRTNRFFSSVVRIQADRGHHVVDKGPYRFVRHPGYVGGLTYGVASAVVLGSLWALIPAGLMAISLMVRTALEDATLRRELSGYTEYAQRVKYRLLPGIW
jgi:protein-S-isoprenylcysteine O-methyltransferase Ste14